MYAPSWKAAFSDNYNPTLFYTAEKFSPQVENHAALPRLQIMDAPGLSNQNTSLEDIVLYKIVSGILETEVVIITMHFNSLFKYTSSSLKLFDRNEYIVNLCMFPHLLRYLVPSMWLFGEWIYELNSIGGIILYIFQDPMHSGMAATLFLRIMGCWL